MTYPTMYQRTVIAKPPDLVGRQTQPLRGFLDGKFRSRRYFGHEVPPLKMQKDRRHFPTAKQKPDPIMLSGFHAQWCLNTLGAKTLDSTGPVK